MTLTSQHKYLIIALAVLLLLYFMNKDQENYGSTDNKNLLNNEHMAILKQDTPPPKQMPLDNTPDSKEISSALDELLAADQQTDDSSSSDEEQRKLKKKMTSKHNSNGKNKTVSYASERPSNNNDDALDQFFSRGNNVTDIGADNNGPFRPMDNNGNMNGDSYAPVKQTKKPSKKQSTKDIFNLDNYLPQQVNDDWFDNVPEPISVKNRNLINASKHVGVNTIGSSHKNPSHDIRGEEYCPKFVVSPWMQSSIEPDTSLVGLCGK